MRFWDASAVAPLLVAERPTSRMQALYAKDASVLVWWGTEVECASAIARLERDAALSGPATDEAFTRLRRLAASWHEVEAGDRLRDTAVRLLRVHPLRAADSLQLAAAHAAAEGRPRSLEIVTLDDRLAAAARKEGFVVLP